MAQNERNDLSKLMNDPRTLSQLSNSPDAQALASLLTQGRDQAQLEQMAQNAMSGDMQSLKTLMRTITENPEGAALLQRLHDSFRSK